MESSSSSPLTPRWEINKPNFKLSVSASFFRGQYLGHVFNGVIRKGEKQDPFLHMVFMDGDLYTSRDKMESVISGLASTKICERKTNCPIHFYRNEEDFFLQLDDLTSEYL